jgi:hypothetical protein
MQEQNQKIWGAADFERYHSGKMTEKERHALEKAALDDPFLEDALDGYGFTQTPVADIAALKEKLWPAEEDVKTPVIWYKQKAISQLFKAAAILIIFGGFGWLIYNNSSKKKGPGNKTAEIASVEKPAAPAANEKAPVFDLKADSLPAVAMLDDQPSQKGMTNIGTGESQEPAGNKPAYDINLPAEADDMARNDSRAKDKASIKVEPGSASSKSNTRLEGKVPGAKITPSSQDNEVRKMKVSAQSEVATNYQGQVRGRIVDQNGQPVPFATISNNAGNRQVTNADAQGNFAFKNNVITNNNLPVEINAVGYDSKQTNLNNNSSNTIVLNQKENGLSEEVITDGYSKTKKEKYQWNGKNSLIHLRNATPLEGWDYFYYVMNDSIVNNHYFNKDKGRIVLQFDADSNGAVKNIIVKRSLNDSADNAVMRIMLKSPVLKINDNKKKGEATIKFNY